ncbi:DapH/DapD/GlmU-related protein [Danxiaibacter flavus]|uniref:DapH/DapD/GlmU-related protein n=1 Tax=Danxiaibacter flavus TaxID=3049108 RepID=A0ABV3ZJ79_9BACT|nr:DapH/DapD/GlmU-related protein [Chitinophagaceae bacterium DXS]
MISKISGLPTIPAAYHEQTSPYGSPWTKQRRIKMLLWNVCWSLLCVWTPKPANRWRLFWMKLFGAKIYGTPFVHQRARIQIPWNLTMHHRATLGDRANAYSLGPIEIGEHATVAQEAYLCTGTHAFDQPAHNLVTMPIIIEQYAFVGARAFVLPGVTIGKHAIVGACSVVTKNVLPHSVVKGNPAK